MDYAERACTRATSLTEKAAEVPGRDSPEALTTGGRGHMEEASRLSKVLDFTATRPLLVKRSTPVSSTMPERGVPGQLCQASLQFGLT